jgi:hypothetical protein
MNSGWTSNSTNVWKKTSGVGTQPNILYFNGQRGTHVTSIGAIVSQYQWFWVGSVLYVYAPGGTDPGAFYSGTGIGIEVGQRSRVIITNNKINLLFDGLNARDGNSGSLEGQIRTGTTTAQNITFQNGISERGRGAGFDFQGATTLDNVKILNYIVRDNGQFGVLGQSAVTGAVIEIGTSLFLSNGWASLEDGQQISNIQGNLGKYYIHDCQISGAAPGTASANDQCHGVYVSTATTQICYIINNLLFGNPNGAGVKARTSTWAQGNYSYNNRLEGFEMGGNGSTDAVYWLIKNVCYGSTNLFNGINQQAKGAGKISLNVYNNTLYQNGGTELGVSDNIDTLRVKNNIFYPSPTKRVMDLPTLSGTFQVDYNLGWNGSGWSANYNSTNYPNLTAWKASPKSPDAHSVEADPLFQSPTALFTPAPGSPAIDAGTPITGIAYSGSAPDMGVFEAGATAPYAVFDNTRNITLTPASSGVLHGEGSFDTDGTISSWSWAYVAGSGPTTPYIQTPIASSTIVSGMVLPGRYAFTLTVTDNDGLTNTIVCFYYVKSPIGKVTAN